MAKRGIKLQLSETVVCPQADGLNVTRVFLYNLDYGPFTQLPPAVPSAPPAVQSRQVPPPDRRPPSGGVPSAAAPAGAVAAAGASAAAQSDAKANVGMIGGEPRHSVL